MTVKQNDSSILKMAEKKINLRDTDMKWEDLSIHDHNI